MNDNIQKEVKTLRPFKRFCMTIGELPSSYVETMSYYEMLLWFTKYLGDTVIPTIDNNAEAVIELQGLFVELKDYVNNYFDNLDVQEEINNKLDDMAESGQLADIIAEYLETNCVLSYDTLNDLKNAENIINGSITKTLGRDTYNDGNGSYYKIRTITSSDIVDNDNIVALTISNTLIAEKIPFNKTLKYYSLTESSATQIIIFPSGKTMFIDTGLASQWSDIKNRIDALGITKFDYGVISHFHTDHAGNIQNFFDNYDLTECNIYVQMKPDFVNHASDIDEVESTYDDTIDLIESNGITPIVPTNNVEITVDYNSKIRFLNTDSTIAENYYGRYKEYGTELKINFNDFSLITEVIHKDVKLLFTSDIERPVTEQYTDYVGKINLMTMPHHGINTDCYEPFYTATMPDFAVANYITDQDNWVGNRHREFDFLRELNRTIITARWSVPTNGAFVFISDGYELYSKVKGSGIGAGAYTVPKIYNNIYELVNETSEKAEDITLVKMFQNMNNSSILLVNWWSKYTEEFPQVYNDIKALFPLFDDNFTIELRRDYSPQYKYLRVFNDKLNFEAILYSGSTWNKKGSGQVDDFNSSNIATTLAKLPKGQYFVNSYTDTSGGLSTNGGYVMNIDIVRNDTAVKAKLEALARNNGSGAIADTRLGVAFYDSTASNQPQWNKVI